jgi:probable F420-dependent oxidoreductase
VPRAAKPFRFSVQCSSLPGATGPSWAALARRCEDLGYSTLTVADHLDDQLAPVPALMAAADATTTLRVGALVFCNDYRHPVVLAKEAATLDVLSGGRLELGLGAGWMTTDYQQAGIALDPASTRIERLAEAVAVVKGLLAPGPCTFTGKHYAISGLDGSPKPVQRPHPPILIGGGGRRVLTLAAREADIVGLNIDLRAGRIDASAGPNATLEATDEKVAWIKEAAGPRFDELELQVRIHLAAVTDDREAMAVAVAAGFGLAPEQALQTPHALAGTVAQIVDDLQVRRERWGISAIGISMDAMDAMAPVVARLAGT